MCRSWRLRNSSPSSKPFKRPPRGPLPPPPMPKRWKRRGSSFWGPRAGSSRRRRRGSARCPRPTSRRPASGSTKSRPPSKPSSPQPKPGWLPAPRRPTASRSTPRSPASGGRLGHLHPLTQTIEELKDIMGRLGFTVAVGPEIEDEWHNFEALNIPESHPARDPLENFYLSTASAVAGQPLLLAQPDEHGADSRHGEHAAAGARSSRWVASIAPTRPTPRTTPCSTRSKACWSIAT